MREEKDEKQNGIHVSILNFVLHYVLTFQFDIFYVITHDFNEIELQRLSTATVVPIVSGEEAEKENGNGEEKEERDEEGESEGRKWIEIVDVRQVSYFMNDYEE